MVMAMNGWRKIRSFGPARLDRPYGLPGGRSRYPETCSMKHGVRVGPRIAFPRPTKTISTIWTESERKRPCGADDGRDQRPQRLDRLDRRKRPLLGPYRQPQRWRSGLSQNALIV